MKKHGHSARTSKKNIAQDDGNSHTIVQPIQVSKAKNLSLIFSKLAAYEEQRSDEDFFRLLGDDSDFLPPSINIEEEIDRIKVLLEEDISSPDKLNKLKNAFQEKLNLLNELESCIPSVLVTCRAAYKKRDLMIMDSLKLRQDIDSLEESCREKAELCRNQQARNKDYEATSQLLLIEEAEKTEELRAKYVNSIVSINKQIADEEAAVTAKKEENDSLAVKITEFNSHLIIRDEHLTTQRKARAIERQLLDAKKTQHIRTEEQRALNSKLYDTHMLQLREAEKDLERQVGLYVEKASSFEATLDDTKAVFQQFEDRAETMMREIAETEQEILKQDVAKAEKKAKLERIQSCILGARITVEEMKLDHSLTDRCRFLQTRRTELTKQLALLRPSPHIILDELPDSGGSTVGTGAVLSCKGCDGEVEDLLDDRPSDEVVDIKSGRTSPHQSDIPWLPSLTNSSSSSRSSSTPPSSSSRAWTDSASKENTAGEDTPVSSPSVHTSKRVNDC